MDEKLNDQDVLLVADKKDDKLNVVTGMGEDGKLKSVSPKPENEPQFLKLDKHGNILENFLTNFHRQYKDPTHFQFFKVPVNMVEKMSSSLQDMLKQPEVPSNKETLDKHRVLLDENSTKQAYKPIDESRIDWKQLERLGVTRDTLEKTGSLDPMLNWGKSPVLIPISPKFDEVTLRTDARLSFRETTDGKLTVAIHAVRKEPQLDKPYFGVNFTEEDKKNLLKTGNVGRLLNFEQTGQNPTPAYISIDKLTNELVAVRADKIRIPKEIKGVKLDDKQMQVLKEGKPIYLEDMLSKSGKLFSATVQVNADKKGIEFRFDSDQKQSQKQSNATTSNQEFTVPKKIGGVELSDADRTQLKAGETIYIYGMKDKQGQEYNAYVKLNPDENKLNFYRWNPDKSKAKEVTPDNASKTQVAVNSEGKTNEATKNVKEPLKQGQNKPTEDQTNKNEDQKIPRPRIRMKN
ncbi:MAG: DUF3945 domain-containing protein [Paludibacter sp.]|nr:DUF3945 domain-containing protein [Paludibacter sp.]